MDTARVFLSHSSSDRHESLLLQDTLRAHGIDAWSYERDMGFGDSLLDRVRASITACDHLIVLLSDAAASSDWVARELGLALQLRRDRDLKHPSIIGVRGVGAGSAHSIIPRDFETGKISDVPFDFTASRYVHLCGPAPDDLAWLATQLRCRVTFIADGDGLDAALFHDSVGCYESLFPDHREREDHANIELWIDAARRGLRRGCPWREVYAVLHLGELVIGMAYVSLHVERHLCFGNYFGVLPTWRQNGRAEWLLEQVWSRLLALDPQLRAITFEIEALDSGALKLASTTATARPPTALLQAMRQLRRLLLYQAYGARAVLGDDGQPLPYVQPALREPLDATNEYQAIMMVLPAPGTAFDELEVPTLIRFLYQDIYGEAYGAKGDTAIPGYDSYLASVERRVLHQLNDGWRFGVVPVSREARRLLSDLKRTGMASEMRL